MQVNTAFAHSRLTSPATLYAATSPEGSALLVPAWPVSAAGTPLRPGAFGLARVPTGQHRGRFFWGMGRGARSEQTGAQAETEPDGDAYNEARRVPAPRARVLVVSFPLCALFHLRLVVRQGLRHTAAHLAGPF